MLITWLNIYKTILHYQQ